MINFNTDEGVEKLAEHIRQAVFDAVTASSEPIAYTHDGMDRMKDVFAQAFEKVDKEVCGGLIHKTMRDDVLRSMFTHLYDHVIPTASEDPQ